MLFRDLMTPLKNNLGIIFFCITLQIILGVILSHTYLLYHNTIHHNGSWISTKTNLEKGVMGAIAFSFRRQALAKGHLNLGAWHGFQEVFYKNKLHAKGVEFDFRLEPNSYLNIIFNKNDKGFPSIRLSVNKKFESKYFVVSALGSFLEKTPIDTYTLRAQRRHNAKLHFDSDEFSLLLDDEEITRFIEPALHGQHIGFRGSLRNVFIDNVLIHQHNSKTLNESFSNRKNAFRITALFLILVGMFNGLIFILLHYAFRIKGKNVGFHLVILDMVLIIISILSFGYLYTSMHYYPQVDVNIRKREEYWKSSKTAEIVKNIRRAYGEIPNKNTYRILFIGSSQTWGAGASKQRTTFVSKFENKLYESGIQETQFECINAGISGLNSSAFLNLYNREWIKLKPRMVVINLSNNDGNIDMFASNLEGMTELSIREGIQPIFVLEANSVEKKNSNLIANHETMRRIAATHNVPIIDMHAHLAKKYDEGFLWWDSVHLTDFGQELVAEKLHKELWQVIKNAL